MPVLLLASSFFRPLRVGLRVLLVTSEYPPDVGGIASHVEELARGLAGTVEHVAVVHAQHFGSKRPRETRLPVAVYRPRLWKGEPFYQILLHRFLAQLLAAQTFDLVHVHGLRPLGATRGLGVPVVFTNHSSGFLARLHASAARQRRTTRLLAHVAQLIAPSDELVEAARRLGYAGPAIMIANGVDPDRFRPGVSALRAAWGCDSTDIVILLARRLVEKNGVVWFARALGAVQAPNIRVVVAGDGPERETMRAILGENGMLSRVVFLGSVENANMPDLYRAADLSVLPSLAEATSIAGLEAMASGLPLVGTRVGGIPAIIADDVTGLLVPPRDPAALATALDRLIADAGLRGSMGRAARTRVEQEFSWSSIAARTVDTYRACLEAR
jgi:glycosyltransferase involved in cell wall biosynthesis